VEVKKHEQAIIKISEALNSVFKTFSIEEIKAVQHKYQGSDFVEKTLGIRAVAAPVVELAGGKIILEKIAEKGMTLCIGEINV
jgi:cobalt-precorrin 5A hydrolase